jgi:predicted chitinase
MSETSITLTQMPLATASLDNSVVIGNQSIKSQQGAKAKPRFAEFACDQLAVSNYLKSNLNASTSGQVFTFAVKITKGVIPRKFWGCDENFKQVVKC